MMHETVSLFHGLVRTADAQKHVFVYVGTSTYRTCKKKIRRPLCLCIKRLSLVAKPRGGSFCWCTTHVCRGRDPGTDQASLHQGKLLEICEDLLGSKPDSDSGGKTHPPAGLRAWWSLSRSFNPTTSCSFSWGKNWKCIMYDNQKQVQEHVHRA